MATSRPFTYNPNSLIPGTEKFGGLTVGYPTSGFESTGLQWWNGPDEDLGYVIATTMVDSNGNGTQPTSIPGVFGNVGFNRTKTWMYSEFIDLVNTRYNQSFTGVTDAKLWLESNGKWTSFVDTTENKILSFDDRLNLDGGVIENVTNLENRINTIGVDDYNKAVIVYTANGYKDGKSYTFKPNVNGADAICFRNTIKTRTNQDGILENGPYNLFPQSENFSTTYFNYGAYRNLTINLPGSPIGTSTVTKYSPTQFNNNLCFNSSVRQFPVNTIINMSVYAKAGEASIFDLGGYFGNESAVFNLSTGIITPRSTNVINYSMENVGNGWFRCNVTYKFTNTIGNGYLYAGISRIPTTTYNGVDGMYFWGFQVTQSNSVKPYIQTMDRRNTPSIDYTYDSPMLLNEQQSTNVFPNNEYFSSMSVVQASRPIVSETNPIGLNSTVKFTSSTADTRHIGYQVYNTTTSGTYSFSFYTKKAEYEFIQVGFALNNGATTCAHIVNLNNGVITNEITNSNYSNVNRVVEELSNGWYRVSVNAYITGITNNVIGIIGLANSDTGVVYDAGSPKFIGDNTSGVYIYGGQLELLRTGSYLGKPTSLILTAGSTSRAADINYIDLQTAGVTLNENNFTLYVEGYFISNGSGAVSISLNNNIGNLGNQYFVGVYNLLNLITSDNGSLLVGGSNFTLNTPFRLIIRRTGTNIEYFRNGVKIPNTFTVPTYPYRYITMNSGSSNYGIKQLLLFNESLSNEECLTKTTL